jgi:hypothetical protein
MNRRKEFVAGVAVAIASLIALFFWNRSANADLPRVMAPSPESVDPSVPEAKLLNGVLYVDGWRRFGNPVGFDYLPRTRPPGLYSVGPGNPPNMNGGSHRGTGNGAIIDAYDFRFGTTRLFGVVEFAPDRTATCDNMKGETSSLCVRNKLNPSATDPDHKWVTVYLTGDHATLTGPAGKEAQRFWADVDIVPLDQATWFTDLVARARAAVQK